MLLRAFTQVLRHPALAPRLAIAILLLSGGVAHANYVWPVDGAPVCIAPGDQHGFFFSDASCGNLAFGWIHSVAGADSLASGWLGPQPPTGECSDPFGNRVEATGITEVSTTTINGFIIALDLPGYCFAPPRAQVFLQGSGAAQQLVVNSPMWNPHVRTVADDGDAVRHHPRMAGSALSYSDTAVTVVWSDERTGVPQIRAQRVTWNGARTMGPSGILIAPTGSVQTEPEISRLQDGSSLVIWSDARSGGSDVYALRLMPDGSAAPGWPAGGLALEDRAEISGAPRIVEPLSYGPRFVAWDESGPRFGGGRSVVARKLNPDGTPDPAWSPLGVVLSSSATVERLQDVSSAGPDLVTVWTDTRGASPENPTDLYAQWLEEDGALATGWPASGLAICTATGRQDAARVSATYASGSEYAAFAWEDHRGGDADVYAELRFANGTLPGGLWVPNGLPATSAPGDQTAPIVGAGNGGGCFVAWEDARDLATSGLDIYAQAFTDLGEKLDAPLGPPPHALALGLPRPNPSRGRAIFSLGVPSAAQGRVDVLDVAGRRVRTLVAREFEAGTRDLVFDGKDDAGRELRPGVYRLLARVGGATTSRTIVLVQ